MFNIRFGRFVVMHMFVAAFAFLQIIGPLEEQEEFTEEDFHLLQKITLRGSAEKVKAQVKQMGMKSKLYVWNFYSKKVICHTLFLCPTIKKYLSFSASDLVMKVDALLAASPKREVRRDVHFRKDTHR